MKSEALTRLNMALAGGRPARAGGVWGSAYALITAGVPRPTLLVVATPLAAEQAVEDLACFGAKASRFDGLKEARRFHTGASDLLVADFPRALTPLPDPSTLKTTRLVLHVGDPAGHERLCQRLADSRYKRTPQVERPGEYATRGGIVDLFPFTEDLPVRIEFECDAVASLRAFDPATQRSLETLDLLDVSFLPEACDAATLFDHLPDGACVVLREPSEMDLRHPDWTGAYALLARHPVLSLSALPQPDAENLKILSAQRFSGALADLERELETVRRRHTVVFCANEGEERRLRELVRTPLDLRRGRLHQGFIFEDLETAFLSNHELFNRYRLRRSGRRVDTRPITDLLEIEKGDLVVHFSHGIGRFIGIERRKQQEFMVLRYAAGAKLFVPACNLDLVQKYAGGTGRPPSLSTLGGEAWNAAKLRAQKAVEKLARDLLQVQALREMELGTAFPPDAEWQRAFEASFPYEETDDQIDVAQRIADDMHAPRPMDRLLCGDVGYGKTELAMRAAFRAATSNRQVAVLVPTTVLAQQHFQTFRERMADYPLRVDVLSRFRSKPEQKALLREAAEGKIDILIGTHRLLQPDVSFPDLGLLIIDEEQRFGVEQKEFLKRLRATVDVLTLTATPIPRTLHMALLGIRDVSTLSTPPQDRIAIRTEIATFDEERIRGAILAERERGGQVYFVHNRVRSIEAMSRRLRMLVPEASFAVGHGQMDERELEKTMLHFLAREVDVLVCTTIIESGLDIPNVNTILINHADRFGLADLHQLRGRVGRYNVPAACHLLLPTDRPVLAPARKRLKAIEEYSELGAGFKIAVRDLEIRGVGNLLGREQHGYIAAVGYDLYCRLLEKSVRKMRNEPVAEPLEAHVDLGRESYIPETHLPDLRARLDAYRRLTACRSEEELAETEREMRDRFGTPPEPLKNFIDALRVKLRAAKWDFASVARGREGMVVGYRDRQKAEALRRRDPQHVRIMDDKFLLIVERDPGEVMG